MPIYEYKCKKCSEISEIIVRSDTKPECEHCGSKDVQKIMSTFSAHNGGQSNIPPCAAGGCGGFSSGACGSGMCGGH